MFRKVYSSPKGMAIAAAERRRRELKYKREPFEFMHYLAVSFRRRVEEQMMARQRDVIFDQVGRGNAMKFRRLIVQTLMQLSNISDAQLVLSDSTQRALASGSLRQDFQI